MPDFQKFSVLTFDCYGTLIDWETGILNAIKPILKQHKVTLSETEILEFYGTAESMIEKNRYLPYREVLHQVVRNFGNEYGFEPSAGEITSLPESIRNWLPFSDTITSLNALKKQYKLAIISNIDDDLFAHSARRLEVDFDWVITAQQAKSYKPSHNNFTLASKTTGISFDKQLHVAQSLFHDIVPANELGIANVWVNRRSKKRGYGATPPAEATPGIEVPDLKTLVKEMNW